MKAHAVSEHLSNVRRSSKPTTPLNIKDMAISTAFPRASRRPLQVPGAGSGNPQGRERNPGRRGAARTGCRLHLWYLSHRHAGDAQRRDCQLGSRSARLLQLPSHLPGKSVHRNPQGRSLRHVLLSAGIAQLHADLANLRTQFQAYGKITQSCLMTASTGRPQSSLDVGPR